MVGYKSVLSDLNGGGWGPAHRIDLDAWRDPFDATHAKIARVIGDNVALSILNTEREVAAVHRDPNLSQAGKASVLRGKGNQVLATIEQQTPGLRKALASMRLLHQERQRIRAAFSEDDPAGAPRAQGIRDWIFSLHPSKRSMTILRAIEAGSVAILAAYAAWPRELLDDALDAANHDRAMDALVGWAHPHLARRIANGDAFAGSARYFLHQGAEYLRERLGVREGVPSEDSINAIGHDETAGWLVSDPHRHVDLAGYRRAAAERAIALQVSKAAAPPFTSFAPEPAGGPFEQLRDARVLEEARALESAAAE